MWSRASGAAETRGDTQASPFTADSYIPLFHTYMQAMAPLVGCIILMQSLPSHRQLLPTIQTYVTIRILGNDSPQIRRGLQDCINGLKWTFVTASHEELRPVCVGTLVSHGQKELVLVFQLKVLI